MLDAMARAIRLMLNNQVIPVLMLGVREESAVAFSAHGILLSCEIDKQTLLEALQAVCAEMEQNRGSLGMSEQESDALMRRRNTDN